LFAAPIGRPQAITITIIPKRVFSNKEESDFYAGKQPTAGSEPGKNGVVGEQ
jgi:hypothetical protein